MKDDIWMSLLEFLIYTKISMSTAYRYMSVKGLPRPSKLAGKVYWKKQDVDTWLSAQLNKGNDNEVEI